MCFSYLFGKINNKLISMASEATAQRPWLKNCPVFAMVFLCVYTFVCVLYPHAMESSKGWAKTYEYNNSAWNKVRNLYMKKTHPSFKNARMHKYTLPAWHSNKNKTSNKITYQTHTQRQSRISANVSTECTLLFTFWTGIFCEKFRVTAMVVLKSNHSVRVCICYRCFLLL